MSTLTIIGLLLLVANLSDKRGTIDKDMNDIAASIGRIFTIEQAEKKPVNMAAMQRGYIEFLVFTGVFIALFTYLFMFK